MSYFLLPSHPQKKKLEKSGERQETEWKVKIFMPFHIKHRKVLKKVFITDGGNLLAVQRAQGREWMGIASSLNGNLIKIKRSRHWKSQTNLSTHSPLYSAYHNAIAAAKEPGVTPQTDCSSHPAANCTQWKSIG